MLHLTLMHKLSRLMKTLHFYLW